MRKVTILANVLLWLGVLVSSSHSVAQPANEKREQDPDTDIQFNLSPPGARSLGLGGAFLALADDVTAAYTNPAGLTNLAIGGFSEVATEIRHWRFAESFPSGGHFCSETSPVSSDCGRPDGLGVDTLDGIQRAEAASDVTDLSFASFAYVLPRGFTVAVYRHELADFKTAFQTQGPFEDFEVEREPATMQNPEPLCEGDPATDPPCLFVDRFLPKRSNTDLKIINHGVSGAYEFPLEGLGGSISVGLGVSYYQFDLLSVNNWYNYQISDPFDPAVERLPGFFFGPADFTDDNVLEREIQTGDDSDVGFNLGFLWKIGERRRWSVGGVFRQGPDFETGFAGFACSGFDETPPTGCLDDAPSAGTFHVPDVYGLGIAFRTAEGRTKLLLDANRVRYSQREADFRPDPDLDPDASDFRIEDADQFHLGLERIVLVVDSLFVGTARIGVWNEPFHGLEYDGSDQETIELLGQATSDEIHVSAGFGLVVKEDYQIDLALDLSDPNDTFSISLVKFF